MSTERPSDDGTGLLARLSAPARTRRRMIVGSAMLAGGGAVSVIGGLQAVFGRAVWQEPANDLEILNFALTLEHLETAFYKEALKQFDQAAFDAANRPTTVRPNLETIRDQEQEHVKTLSKAITDFGGTPVEPAKYAFGYQDLTGFFQVAAAVENGGVAAYAGVAPLVTDKAVLAILLGLHSVEARHAGYLNARIEVSPFPDPVDRPLTPDEASTLFATYITEPAPLTPAAAATATSEPRRPDEPKPTGETTGEPKPTVDISAPLVEPPGISGSTGKGNDDDKEETPTTDQPTAEAGTGASPDDAPADTGDRKFADLLDDAAARLGVAPADLVVDSTRQEWPDESLGCPAPDQVYAQVVTPGFLVLVTGAGTTLEYHTDKKGDRFVLCQNGAPVA